uniref:BPTI/Kunitz inhibitor domain-containing protein n=1 Tax=Caenorhabditis japonica TaxID=281687 RepID=A0A8R1HKR2_CAEJA
MLKLALLSAFIIGSAAQFRQQCEAPLHHGLQQCSNTSSIRYHFDLTTKKCLAFKFSGCGGNSNNFASYSECQNFCLPMDYFTCPGGTQSLKNKNGKSFCGGVEQVTCDAPNSFCLNGPFTGVCCDAGIRDKVNDDYEKECGPGKLKHQIDIGGVHIPLFGKTCDSAFCPENTKCQQGNFFAYCCA